MTVLSTSSNDPPASGPQRVGVVDLSGLARGEPQRLADRRRCRIRRLHPSDAAHIEACFERMSNEARQTRFFGAKRRLSAAEIAFFSAPDGWDHIALGAVELTDGGREADLLGAVRCVRIPGARGTADFAIAIADEVRGLGLGDALLTALIRQARPRGIRAFHCEVLRRNGTMRRLAERFGGELVEGGDTLVYRLPVAAKPAPLDAWPAGAWSAFGLVDPVAARHDWCDLLDTAAACGVAALQDAGAYCLPGALLAA
jgi:RimJ/RimL family protein N-acetyltransferase